MKKTPDRKLRSNPAGFEPETFSLLGQVCNLSATAQTYNCLKLCSYYHILSMCFFAVAVVVVVVVVVGSGGVCGAVVKWDV